MKSLILTVFVFSVFLLSYSGCSKYNNTDTSLQPGDEKTTDLKRESSLLVPELSDNYVLNLPWVLKERRNITISEENILLTTVSKTISSKGATFSISNVCKEDISFGTEYWLQVRINDEWFDIDVAVDWTLELFEVHSGEEVDVAVDWSEIYGVLPNGEYRLIKEFSLSSAVNFYVSCEFILEP